MNSIAKARKLITAGACLLALAGFSLHAQAQPTCTIVNWQGTPEGSPQTDYQDEANNFRRYGGPCGLRVAMSGSSEWVADTTPGNLGDVSEYAVRFYVYVSDVTQDVLLFAAESAANEDVIEVSYLPGSDEVEMVAYNSDRTASAPLTVGSVGSGWHSISLDWVSDSNPTLTLSVDELPAASSTGGVDTSGILISTAYLGNLNGVSGGEHLNFDDFDSRRADPAPRLLVGDADGNESIGIGDAVDLLSELNDLAFAPGQPDCNEDGSVGIGDAVCLLNLLNQ